MSAQPEIDEAIKNALPTGSFKRRFLKKRGVQGYSKDLQRSFATYMKMGAGHISRVKHAEDMLMRSAKLVRTRLISRTWEGCEPKVTDAFRECRGTMNT